MSDSEYTVDVGIDWGSQEHRVVVVNRDRTVVHERTVQHGGAELAALAHWLVTLVNGAAGSVAVALEVPRGPIVETMLDHGMHVYAINPKQLDRFRDRYTVAGAKDDRRDALVLGTALVTDRPAFRRLDPDEPAVVHLRALTRLEEELDEEHRRLSNRLREQLYRLAPGLLTLSPGADEPWLWALLARAPTPAAARRLTRATLARILSEHRIRRLTADDVVAVLRAPALAAGPGAVVAAEEQLAVLLPRLQLSETQRKDCQRRVRRALDALPDHVEHRDVAILRSLPGVGRKVSATMLAEAWPLLARRDYHALRSHAGTAPVTKQSGKWRQVRMRYACNARLRNAVHHWARNSAQRDPRIAALYQRLRARGKSEARALRSVGDRLLAMLVAMLKTQTLYDPSRRCVQMGA
jgi:transposase